MALAKMHPSLRFIVQMNESASRTDDILCAKKLEGVEGRHLTMQSRAPAAVQSVKDAAVYILRLTESSSLREQVIAELNVHLPMLRANASSTLILALPSLPEPGSVDPDVEATARLWDLSRMQLTNECELEASDLVELINSVQDSRGRLVVVNKLCSRNSTMMVVGVKYEAGIDGFYSVEPFLM
jgi:hydroxyacyl-ACP dehydratase HTD2-like protein with hotdog domain